MPRYVYTTCACGCGEEFAQPWDPGRYRQYLNRAHQMRAYRRRHPGKNHSGTHRETAGARQRRAEREAWAAQEAAREQERQRSAKRRQAPEPPPRPEIRVPAWVWVLDTDAAQKKRRRTCRLLYQRAAHRSTPLPEAEACVARAEEIRRRYGL